MTTKITSEITKKTKIRTCTSAYPAPDDNKNDNKYDNKDDK